MNPITAIWTVVAVGLAGFVATGGGHPPGIILVPFVFAARLVGAVAMELIARWRDPRRSIRRSVVFLATAALLFVAAPVTTLTVRELRRSLEMGRDQVLWHLGLGPFLLIATVASLWQLYAAGLLASGVDLRRHGSHEEIADR